LICIQIPDFWNVTLGSLVVTRLSEEPAAPSSRCIMFVLLKLVTRPIQGKVLLVLVDVAVHRSSVFIPTFRVEASPTNLITLFL
jgi:hypothetical protein